MRGGSGAPTGEATLIRFRLRFLLQEFDLARGETLLGRSSDCHFTIEDPLVSRHHARIVVADDRAYVEDLGSRNGVKVNGLTISGPTVLADGDRVRIGTQELVFSVSATAPKTPVGKTTGFLRHCARCRLPYAQEAGECPSCGATAVLEEETLSGRFGNAARAAWTLQLLVEVVEKAARVARYEEGDRALQRAAASLEEAASREEAVDEAVLGRLVAAAVQLAVLGEDVTWALWATQTIRRFDIFPTEAVVDGLSRLARPDRTDVHEAVARLSSHAGSVRPPTSEAEARALEGLVRLHASLSGRP